MPRPVSMGSGYVQFTPGRRMIHFGTSPEEAREIMAENQNQVVVFWDDTAKEN